MKDLSERYGSEYILTDSKLRPLRVMSQIVNYSDSNESGFEHRIWAHSKFDVKFRFQINNNAPLNQILNESG